MANDPKIYANTYWCKKGKYPVFLDALEKLVPPIGEVDKYEENPALETFREACNCYYDLFNNGLCNCADEFKEIFGFSGPYIEHDYDADEYGDREDANWWTKENINRVESIMNRIILKAAKEQGIKP